VRSFASARAHRWIASTTPAGRSRVASRHSRQATSILELQRTVGNRAVRRLLDVGPRGPDGLAAVRASTIGAPGDVFEQEADRVSEQVVRMPEAPRHRAGAAFTPATTSSPIAATLSSAGRPLDAVTRRFMESRFGRSFGDVRVHTGARADDATRAVQARAFTLNRDIVFGAGQYDPHRPDGRRLLAHELTHVIQQSADSGAATPASLPVYHRPSTPAIQRQKSNPAEPSAEDPAFWEWWKKVVAFEGSLEAWKAQPANKSDRGGETNWGVTKKLYMERATALGLPATDEGFAAMTPDQAMLFGKMIWKASGAQKVENTGVALVLADWYWGGIDLTRFSTLLKEKGRAATFNEGKPDADTIAFLNTLAPAELIALMSKAKADQYRQIVAKDASQQKFLKGWLDRNEHRRVQAQPFVPGAKFPPKPGMTLSDRGQRALREARDLLQTGEKASADDRSIVNNELWSVVGAIEQKQKSGFDNPQEEAALNALKGELLKEIGRLMDVAH